MATPAPSWVSPATSGQIRRSQYLSDAIRQMQGSRTPDSYRTNTATIANTLADAIMGYAQNNANDKADAALKADQIRVSDLIRDQFPGQANPEAQRELETQQLGSNAAFDLTPKAFDARAQQTATPSLASLLFEATGDPVAAISAGVEQQQAMKPNYQFLQGPDGAIVLGDQNTGGIRELQSGAPKSRPPIIIGSNAYDPETYEPVIQGEEKPPWVGAVKDANGQWITDPNYINGYRQMHPQQPGGASGAWVDVPAAEMEALGYPKGTIGQRNSATRQIEVKARPSASQTGQPTEGERSAALHSSISMNGLRNIMQMEGGGYNRAGLGEQFSTFWGENEKLYDQGAAEFIDGYLRAMTGAAATATEIDTYRKQWFPQFGDNDKVIAQKSAGRLNALKSMKLKAGRAWNPEWDAVITSLEQGVSTPAASPQQQRAVVDVVTGPDGKPLTPESAADLKRIMQMAGIRGSNDYMAKLDALLAQGAPQTPAATGQPSKRLRYNPATGELE